MKPRLLQVCNVGQICGGTAACAWTVTRALPGFEHVVAFLGPIANDTRTAFAPHRLYEWRSVSAELVSSARPDIVLLHNTSRGRVREQIRAPRVMYLHSQIRSADADVTVCCSRWLAERMRMSPEDVLWQAVPKATKEPGRVAPVSFAQYASDAILEDRGDTPRLLTGNASLTIGRICTPQARKWPMEIVPFYRRLAERFPSVRWEFVGCPLPMQRSLQDSCNGRVRFWSAGWERRSLLTTWDALLYHQPRLPESFGRTVAEGMRVGCVPIVDVQGGFIEQLENGGGFLCADEAAFHTAVERLQDANVLKQTASRAKEIGNERWSLTRFARELLRRFDEAA